MELRKIQPKEGQESVWDYPRPPAIEAFSGHIRVIYNGEIIIDTHNSFRILETSHPPAYYLPIEQFRPGVLVPSRRTSFCEFKGEARYFDLALEEMTSEDAAWYYPDPNKRYAQLEGHVAIYAHMVDECIVNGEKVRAQEGDFYGGWITSNIIGPFKGAPGTWGW